MMMCNVRCTFLAVGHIFVAPLQQQMENAEAERDVYDELLTQAEIQGNVNKVNGKSHEHNAFVYWFVDLGLHGAAVNCQRLSYSDECLECS